MTFYDIRLFQFDKFYIFLGKPSIKNLDYDHPFFNMAFYNNRTVIELGTILPSTMYYYINWPSFDYGFERYSRSKSPADK